MLFSLTLLCACLAAASTLKNPHAHLQKRDNTVCTDLSVSSNNGDRKVAIVLDSSGSMSYNDPYDLRVKAGRALNEFLISSSEASGGQKADLVTVIDFDDEAYLDYPLGDPGSANSSFDHVDATGGTYIASGVNMAIAQLTGGGGGTDKRSAIVVFTDGEVELSPTNPSYLQPLTNSCGKKDSSTDELVDAINNATAAGIRVSFGFLDTSASSQPPTVLSAVKDSRGVYATITVAAGSQNFINYVLLNGLTYNDNPQGYDSQLLAGLAETHFVSGSDTVTLKYSAQKGERVNFTITSISAGFLGVSAVMGGKELNTTNTTYSYSVIDVTPPSSGELDLKITARAALQDSMFSVITNSNVPFKNCTVGVTGGGGGGLSAGGKAGVGIGVTAALLGLGGLGGYFAYKHFLGGGGGGNAVPPSGGESNTVQFGGDGGEKMMAHTDVYPVDQMSHGLPPGDGTHGLMGQGPPNGPAAPMSGPPGSQSLAPPSMQGAVPPSTAPMGAPPTSGVPPTGAPPSSGLPPTGGPAYAASQPMAFVPPLVPPNVLNPNNTAPKEKGSGAPQGQSGPMAQQGDGQYHMMQNYQPGNFGQQMAPGTGQPMGANASHPMSPGAPASQGVPGPAGSSGYPPNPQSQAPFGYSADAYNMAPGTSSPMGSGGPPAPGSQMPLGHGADAHTMSPGSSSPMSTGGYPPTPGSQMPFGHGGQSMAPSPHAPTGTGSYPPAPSSQATPAPSSQYAPGAESMQHNSEPGAYQDSMGHGDPGQMHGSNYQSSNTGPASPMSGTDGYTHTIGGAGGAGGQHAVPNPMSSDPNFNYPSGQPMSGTDGYNHTMQSHMSPDNYHQNGSMSDNYHQHGSSPSPQGTGSLPSGPSSTAPTMTPQGPGSGLSGSDMYHHHHHPQETGPPPDPSSQSHPDPGSSQSNPSGADMTHHQTPPDHTADYHDPDACSCSEGPGPDSDFEGGQDPSPGASGNGTNAGFYMPGAPFRPADKKKEDEDEGNERHKHKRRRFPRLARSRVEKHHHHAWTGRDRECEDAQCVFNRGDHVCVDRKGCECKCRDERCEVYKRRLRERRGMDGGLTGVANLVS
jgi:Mg-chelatase subunit ChlD